MKLLALASSRWTQPNPVGAARPGLLNGKASLNGSLPTQLRMESKAAIAALPRTWRHGAPTGGHVYLALAASCYQKPFKAADADVRALLLVGLAISTLHPRAGHPAKTVVAPTITGPGPGNAVPRRQRESESSRARNMAVVPPPTRAKNPEGILARAMGSHLRGQQRAPPMILRVNRRHHTHGSSLSHIAWRSRCSSLRLQPGRRSLQNRAMYVTCRSLPKGWISVLGLKSRSTGRRPAGLAPVNAAYWTPVAPRQQTLPASWKCKRTLAGGVVAVDLEAKRLRVRENLARLGLSARLIAADGRDTATWWDGKPFSASAGRRAPPPA